VSLYIAEIIMKGTLKTLAVVASKEAPA